MKFSATLQMVLTERLNLKVYDFFVWIFYMVKKCNKSSFVLDFLFGWKGV